MSAPTAMTVQELLQGRAAAGAAGDIVVRGLCIDSRRVRAGDVFVALAGAQAHGLDFAPMAVARGAAVILAEEPGIGLRRQDAVANGEAGPQGEPRMRRVIRDSGFGKSAKSGESKQSGIGDWGFGDSVGVPIVWVDGLRAELGAIAARLFGEPSKSLRVVGVTGTNGKTSIVQLLAQALELAGLRSATIGTLGAGLYGAVEEGKRTTPDAIAVQALLARFRDAGASHVAMEVSSHALEQGRVNAVDFELAVFTNLSRDHLDYHGSMDAYGAAKQRLFAWPGLGAAVINIDDAFGRSLAAQLPATLKCLRYAIEGDADVRASAIESGAAGQRFSLVTPWGQGEVRTRLLGRFNISNLLAVATCLGQLGVPFATLLGILGALNPVAGRMSRLGGDAAQPLVVIDYAHTPDALEQALSSLRAHCAGQLLCVFGCGGERDAGKRPQMGAIAERLADRVFITDDNPRGEDGHAIVAQIVAGLAQPQAASIERDRAGAIALAIASAGPGDIVLIAGKGHEPYQEIAGVKQPFDDLAVARRVLELRPC